MGLFSRKETCCICNIEKGKQKLMDGFVCKNCLKSCGGFYPIDKPFKTAFKIDVLDAINRNRKNKDLINQFKVTKKIGSYIEFDEDKKQWLIPDGFNGKKINPKVHSYSDIIDYELLEDGESITKGGLGRAVVGGALLGGVGAIVGGTTGKRKTKSVIKSLRIKITVNQTINPSIYINLIYSETKSSSIIYKAAYASAQEILSMFSIITRNNEVESQQENTTTTVSTADELIKLKGLLDEGILTQKEFMAEKNKILSK